MLHISGRALSRITSSFMVLTSDSSKDNLGLSLKFEAKSLKVVDYSRKEGRHWEFSEKTINLIREYKVMPLIPRFNLLNLYYTFLGAVPRSISNP